MCTCVNIYKEQACAHVRSANGSQKPNRSAFPIKKRSFPKK